jgi:hypothetical protein
LIYGVVRWGCRAMLSDFHLFFGRFSAIKSKTILLNDRNVSAARAPNCSVWITTQNRLSNVIQCHELFSPLGQPFRPFILITIEVGRHLAAVIHQFLLRKWFSLVSQNQQQTVNIWTM